MVGISREFCTNCGQPIGMMERTHTYADRLVCGRCFRRLTGKANVWPFARVAVVCLAVGYGLGFLSGRSRPAGKPLAPAPADAKATHAPTTLPAVISASTNPSTGSLTGSVWVSRADGSSEVPAGVKVSLLRATASRPAVEASIRAEIALWDAYATENESRAKAIRDQQPDASYDFGAVWDEQARYARAKIDALNKVVATLPAEMGVADAYRVVVTGAPAGAQEDWSRKQLDAQMRSIRLKGEGKDYASGVMNLVAQSLAQFQTDWVRRGTPRFDDVVTATRIREATTDAGGKYTLADLAAGDYFLHAKILSDTAFAEWVVPVHVGGGAQISQDLFKQDAGFNVDLSARP